MHKMDMCERIKRVQSTLVYVPSEIVHANVCLTNVIGETKTLLEHATLPTIIIQAIEDKITKIDEERDIQYSESFYKAFDDALNAIFSEDVDQVDDCVYRLNKIKDAIYELQSVANELKESIEKYTESD